MQSGYELPTGKPTFGTRNIRANDTRTTGHDAGVAGRAKKEGGRKTVIIPSLGLAYKSATLPVRCNSRIRHGVHRIFSVFSG